MSDEQRATLKHLLLVACWLLLFAAGAWLEMQNLGNLR